MNKDFRPSAITSYYIFQQCFKEAGLIDGNIFEVKEWSIVLKKKLVELFKKLLSETLGLPPDDPDVMAALRVSFGVEDKNGEYPTYHNYLRDRFRKITEELLQKNFLTELPFQRDKFEPLLHCAGIKDYKIIDDFFAQKSALSHEQFLIKPIIYLNEKRNKKADYEPLINFDELKDWWLDGAIENTPGYLVTTRELVALAPVVDHPDIYVEPQESIQEIRIPVVVLEKPIKWFNFISIPDNGELVFTSEGDCYYQGTFNISFKKGTIITPETYPMKGDLKEFWVKVVRPDVNEYQTIYFAELQPDLSQLKLADPDRLLSALSALSIPQNTL